MCSTFKVDKVLSFLLAIFFLALCHVSSTVCSPKETDDTQSFLKVFSFGHISSYVSTAKCPDQRNGVKRYFTGVRIRLSNYLNQSHDTVNAMEFRCSDGIHATVQADETLIIQKNIGNWTGWKECPNGGFVTGIALYMQTVSSPVFMPDEVGGNSETPETGRVFDVFELVRTRYISGISLNCSLYSDIDEPTFSDNSTGSDNQASSVLSPAWKDTVTLGRASGMGLRLYCLENRVIAGVSAQQEALITYSEGERWLPIEIRTTCVLLRFPMKECSPELDWETLDNLTCTINGTGNNAITPPHNTTGPVNVTCQFPHLLGLSTNKDIENLAQILRAYETLNLEGQIVKSYLRSRILSLEFTRDWIKKYKLTDTDYMNAIQRLPVNTYIILQKMLHIQNFTNVNYTEPDYCRKIRNVTTEPLKYEFNVKQLVGFCSIYKFYFPLFRTQFHTYFERKIDGIRSRVIFPQAGDNSSAKEAFKSKLSLLTKVLKLASMTNILKSMNKPT